MWVTSSLEVSGSTTLNRVESDEMAVTYVHTCDECGERVEVEHGPFGASAIPEGWVHAENWPGADQKITCCSWACIAKAAMKKVKKD